MPFAVQFLSEIQKYSDEIRLVIAYELDTKKYLRFSCYHDFDHYKTPSECGKCNTAEENVQRAGLIKYFKSAGERVFKTDKDQVEKIILKAVYSLDDMNKRFEFVNRISKVRDAPAVDENLISELRGKLEILKKYKTEEKEKGTNALQAMRKDFMELFVTLNKEITNTGVEKYVAEYLNK